MCHQQELPRVAVVAVEEEAVAAGVALQFDRLLPEAEVVVAVVQAPCWCPEWRQVAAAVAAATVFARPSARCERQRDKCGHSCPKPAGFEHSALPGRAARCVPFSCPPSPPPFGRTWTDCGCGRSHWTPLHGRRGSDWRVFVQSQRRKRTHFASQAKE